MKHPRFWLLFFRPPAPLVLCIFMGFVGCGDRDSNSVRAEAARGPVSVERVRVIGETDGVDLFEVRDAAFNGADLAVLTEPEPAVHLFSRGDPAQWGAEGEGPAELANPVSILWDREHLVVLDFQPGDSRIVSYDAAGELLASRATAPHTAQSVAITDGDTLIGTSQFGSTQWAVLRLRGESFDTLFVYEEGEQVHLTAEGAPSLTLTAPFAPTPHWTMLADGRVAFWDGSRQQIHLLGPQGDSLGALPVPSEPYPVTAEGREAWFEEEIPDDFMGRGDIFAPLREKAREELEFPASYAAILELLPDPEAGVWIRRTPAADGQVWTRVTSNDEEVTIRLPPGRQLLAVGESELAALVRDELDVETIEVYRRPGLVRE